MSADWAQQFLTLGTQYYVAGRSAALARLIPVSGNLLHHAVEMLLKGTLIAGIAPDELRKVGHRLTALWAIFKKQHDQEQLANFDELINRLHAFERIRYPDRIVASGAFISVGFGATAAPLPGNNVKSDEPVYAVDVCKIDRLVSVIFTTTSFNVEFFKAKLTPEAKRILGEGNKWLD